MNDDLPITDSLTLLIRREFLEGLFWSDLRTKIEWLEQDRKILLESASRFYDSDRCIDPLAKALAKKDAEEFFKKALSGLHFR